VTTWIADAPSTASDFLSSSLHENQLDANHRPPHVGSPLGRAAPKLPHLMGTSHAGSSIVTSEREEEDVDSAEERAREHSVGRFNIGDKVAAMRAVSRFTFFSLALFFAVSSPPLIALTLGAF